MKMLRFMLFFLISCGAMGQPAIRNFTFVKATDGSEVSLDTYDRYEAIVVVFTGHACPFDGYYRERLRALIQAYGTRVQFLLVNAYLEAEESIEKMKEVYPSLGLPVPYLADKNQAAFLALGARKSPEVFLLKPATGGYAIWYSGAIDDSPQAATATTSNYLKQAIDNLLSGKGPMPAQRAVGCTIRAR